MQRNASRQRLFVAEASTAGRSVNLLEDLAVGELHGLAVDDDGLVPGPHVVDELAVLGLGGVELGEFVGLDIGGDFEGGGGLLATDNEGTLDDGVVGLAEDGTGTEDVLAAALETSEEATDLVVAHEGHGELVVVKEVHAPDGELVELAVLPEPGKGVFTGLVVGVLALPVDLLACVEFDRLHIMNIPVVKNESGLAKELERVLGLRGSRSGLLLLLLLSSGLDLGLRGSLRGLRSSGLLLLLLLLVLRARRGLVVESLLGEDGVLDNGRVDVLGNDGAEPTGDVGVLGAPLGVPEELEAAGDDAGDEEVGKGEALADEVGVDKEVVLKDLDVGLGGLEVLIDALLVVGVTADQGTERGAKGREDLGVGEGHPAEDAGVVLLGLAEESGLLVLGGDCAKSLATVPLVFS